MPRAFKSEIRLQEPRSDEQRRLCFVSMREIEGDFADDAIGMRFHVSMLMQDNNENGVKDKGSDEERQIPEQGYLQACRLAGEGW